MNTAHDIAEQGLILQVEVGSRILGLNLPGSDDQDLMGIAIEPPTHVIGSAKFDQYIFRTQPEGERSGPGDIDLTVYSLRKWFGLALSGNPSIIMLLWAPEDAVQAVNVYGEEVLDARDKIISKQAGARFLGYMEAQRLRFLGVRGGTHTNRPELIEKYGYDTKYAYHMLRLGMQGIELMDTGKLTLPMRDKDRRLLMNVRHGVYSKEAVAQWAEDLQEELKNAIDNSELPERPDKDWANQFLVDMYMSFWQIRRLV